MSSGTVHHSSAVTMESAVFKFPTNIAGSIEISGALTLTTTNFRPAIFTAADDNTAGTTLSATIWSNYTGNPSGKSYGNIALWLNTSANVALNNLRFCYARQAMQITADTAGQSVTLSHSQLVNCLNGINIIGGDGEGGSDTLSLSANNCLLANVQYPFQVATIKLTGNARNCTIDSCVKLLQVDSLSTGIFGFTNTILSGVASNGFLASLSLKGGYNGFYGSPAFGSPQTVVSSNPYQTVGAGSYYLSPSSLLCTNGTTNIGASLLSQLQTKTTQGPAILTNTFTTNTVLIPVTPRDSTGTTLGYHYEPVDYISACAVSNATLFLTNGIVMAYYDNLGIWLQDGSQLVSQGSPIQRNFLVYYGLAQEEPLNSWGVTNAVARSLPIAPSPFGSSANPSITLRLTTICVPQGQTNLLNTGDTGQVISGLTMRDCEVYGAGANWQMNESNNTPAVSFINNVFHRVPFAINSEAKLAAFNNLFYGTTNVSVTNTTVSIRYRAGSSPNTNQNNAFDGVTASLDGAVGYNAYLHGATNTVFQLSDMLTNLAWVAGPLGAYYQPANSSFINSGSAAAGQFGLYQYTVTTNLIGGWEIKETNSVVDRGYHYVAVDASNNNLDSNGDGVPDYLEDANGDGLYDPPDPADWLNPNLRVLIFRPAANSRLP